MKAARKILTILVLGLQFAFCVLCASSADAFAAETNLVPVVPEIPFVRIGSDGVYLYGRDEIAGTFFPVTALPKSYYASAVEDYNAEYYRVIYYDLEGYVKKSEVAKVDYEPVTKYATGKLQITALVIAVPCLARPDHFRDNVVAEVKKGETLVYYGKIQGTAPEPARGDEWYYIKIISENEEPLYGYIYAPYVTAAAIPENTGEKVLREESSGGGFEPAEPEFPSYLAAVFILCLCIPAVLVMLLLFRKKPEQKRRPRSF